jgi:hypothetical protein
MVEAMSDRRPRTQSRAYPHVGTPVAAITDDPAIADIPVTVVTGCQAKIDRPGPAGFCSPGA